MTLITNEEIQILNSARRTLKDIYSRAEGAHADVDDNAYSKGSWYRNRGRLVEQAHGAESAIFRTLNIAKSYCDQDISDWQMHLREVPAEVYAEQLVRLVKADITIAPGEFIAYESWQDLHGARVANEYLIAADEIFGITEFTDEHIQLCNEAIKIAEKTLFGKEDS